MKLSKEILLKEFAKARGIMPRSEFTEYISKKYHITVCEAKKEIRKYCNVFNLPNTSEDGRHEKRKHERPKWGEERVKKLIELREAGKSNGEIAIILDSTKSMINWKISCLIREGHLKSKYKRRMEK